MVEAERKTLKDYQWRARLPQYVRIAALAAAGIVILAVVYGYFNARSKSPFKLRGEHTQLSTEVTAEVNNYERLESVDGVPKYLVRADFAKTFADNHQELSNVYIEVFDPAGGASDRLNAASALYIPEENKNFTAYLSGNVNIDTRDRLNVKTSDVVYAKATDTAEADELVEFARDGIKGRSRGATVKIGEKRIELRSAVEIETFDTAEALKSNIRYAKVNAGDAVYDHLADRLEMHGGVRANLVSAGSAGQVTDVKAGRAVATLTGADDAVGALTRLELFDSVEIVSSEGSQGRTTMASAYALYDKPSDRFELKGGVHVVAQRADVRAANAVYERSNGRLALYGSVELRQGIDTITGDTLAAQLDDERKIKHVVIRGNANASKKTPERSSSITAPEMNAEFNDLGNLKDANAIGESTFEIIPADASRYQAIKGRAARGIGATFKGDDLFEALRTEGRTTIDLIVVNDKPDATNKRLSADAVRTVFSANGKDVARAEAAGNSQLEMLPHNSGPTQYRTTVSAPKFDCSFYPTGNSAEVCTAERNAKATRVPTVPTDSRGEQTVTAERMVARFDQASGEIDTMTAAGNVKFNERDRNAAAQQMEFTEADGFVRLRGGEPTYWDARARAKAREIDLDTRGDRSSLRGGVSTTYYAAKQARSATPFASSQKPVFVTADSADIDNANETALYRGKARGWQENNYVRADSLFIEQRSGRLTAEGNVQSTLFNTRSVTGGAATTPVNASAGTLVYDRDARVVRLRTNVDVRQKNERLTAGLADILLDENFEVAKTVAQQNVVITQPGRRATGNFVEYTAADEVAVIRGEPATVTDAQNGSAQGSQMTFGMRDQRFEVAGRVGTGRSGGRTRTVYKVKPQ